VRLRELTYNEDEDQFDDYDDASVGIVDWKAYAGEIFEILDRQLAAFGLEVVEYDQGGDYYMWCIERRAAPGPDSLAARLRRIEGERASLELRQVVGDLFLRRDVERGKWGREEAKRRSAASAAIKFLRVHLGDRFDEFAALLDQADSKSERPAATTAP
jgi:hypothetical protein